MPNNSEMSITFQRERERERNLFSSREKPEGLDVRSASRVGFSMRRRKVGRGSNGEPEIWMVISVEKSVELISLRAHRMGNNAASVAQKYGTSGRQADFAGWSEQCSESSALARPVRSKPKFLVVQERILSIVFSAGYRR